jgi:hypothetical protein
MMMMCNCAFARRCALPQRALLRRRVVRGGTSTQGRRGCGKRASARARRAAPRQESLLFILPRHLLPPPFFSRDQQRRAARASPDARDEVGGQASWQARLNSTVA